MQIINGMLYRIYKGLERSYQLNLQYCPIFTNTVLIFFIRLKLRQQFQLP